MAVHGQTHPGWHFHASQNQRRRAETAPVGHVSAGAWGEAFLDHPEIRPTARANVVPPLPQLLVELLPDPWITFPECGSPVAVGTINNKVLSGLVPAGTARMM
jgi:hypothetical protein